MHDFSGERRAQVSTRSPEGECKLRDTYRHIRRACQADVRILWRSLDLPCLESAHSVQMDDEPYEIRFFLREFVKAIVIYNFIKMRKI